jgi:hypothetical protein
MSKEYVINVKHKMPDIEQLNKNLTNFTKTLRDLAVGQTKTSNAFTPLAKTKASDFNRFAIELDEVTTKPLKTLSGNFRFVNYEIQELNKQTTRGSRLSSALANNMNQFGSNLVGYIMAFLGASFTFSFITYQLEKNLQQFDRLADAARRLSSLNIEINPDVYDNLQSQLMTLAENLNVSFSDISTIADNAAFASEDLGQAFDRIRLAAAIARTSGMSLKQATQYLVGAMEGDSRSIKAIRRYLGMEAGEMINPTAMWQKISKGLLANDVQLEETVRSTKIKLSSLWSYVDDTTDNLSVLFYDLVGKMSDAIFGFGKNVNTFQKIMRNSVGGLGAGLLLLSKGVSNIGQFGLAVFGLVELQKVLTDIAVGIGPTIAGLTGLSGAVGALATGGIVAAGLFGLGWAISKLGELARSAARKMEAMRVATNIWLSSIINSSKDVNDMIKKIGEATLEGIKYVRQQVNNELQQTAITSITGIEKGGKGRLVVETPYKIKLSSLPEWKNIQEAIKKYQEEYKKFGYVSTKTAEMIQKTIEDNIDAIVKNYNLTKKDATRLGQVKKYLYQFLSSFTQLSDLAEKTNVNTEAIDKLKKRMQYAFNQLNELLDIQSKYAHYTGNVGMEKYFKVFKDSLNMMKQFYTKEGIEALKQLHTIAPSLYNQIAPTKDKFVTIMKGMWLDSINYWQKIKVNFKGGMESINEAVQNNISKMLKGQMLENEPNFNNMYTSIVSIIKKLDTTDIGTKIDTTNAHLTSIKQELHEINAKVKGEQQTSHPLINKIEKETGLHIPAFGIPYGVMNNGS